MKYYITGSTGMLGSSFLKYTKRYDQDFLEKTEMLNFDLTKEPFYDILTRKDEDFIVIHIAGQKGSNIQKLLQNNIIATSKLISNLCLLDNCMGLIYISSISVFGIQDQTITEHSIRKPDNYYGFSKKICEDIIYETLKDKRYIILRPTNTFSEDRSTMIGNLLHKLVLSEPFEAWEESLKVKRDYISILEVNNAIMTSIDLVTKKDIQDSINLVGENIYNLQELISELEDITGQKLKLNIKTQEGFRSKDLKIKKTDKLTSLINTNSISFEENITKIFAELK